MVHLLPLPGSPLYQNNFKAVLARAHSDSEKLIKSGFDGFIIENYGDKPFFPDKVPYETITAMSIVTYELKKRFSNKFIGINVLRNDPVSAMIIASIVNVDFIRVNVFSYSVLTDQGIINSKSYDVLRIRKNLNSNVKIFADIRVKHSYPIANYPIEQEIEDTLFRHLADALILTGPSTGKEVNIKLLKKLKNLYPQIPILVGSGVNNKNVKTIFSISDGFIVGTYIKADNITDNPVDINKARELIELIKS